MAAGSGVIAPVSRGLEGFSGWSWQPPAIGTARMIAATGGPLVLGEGGMFAEGTRRVVEAYLGEHGLDALAEDVVYTVMGSGRVARGRAEVAALLDHFYHQAFQATARGRSLVVGETQAVFEGDFEGRHVGEFAGIPATMKSVSVPLCVVYDIAGDRISAARIYFEMDALREQLGR